MYTHSLQDRTKPTRPHKVRFTGQGQTCTHTAQVPASKTTQSQVRCSGKYNIMYTHSIGPCLQDHTKSVSPVRDIHVHTQHRSLPTRPHKVRFAGQGHTYMYTHSTGPCLQDRTKSGLPVRDTHTHTAQVPAYKTTVDVCKSFLKEVWMGCFVDL